MRPTARGKKRSRRSHDPFELWMGKLDRWVDKNPMKANALTGVILGLAVYVFWAMFGESIVSLYAKHLGPSLDPWLVKHVVPHYITVRDVVVDAARKTGLDKVGGFLSAVAAKASAMSQAKEL
mgnify:CR=1 FL=1